MQTMTNEEFMKGVRARLQAAAAEAAEAERRAEEEAEAAVRAKGTGAEVLEFPSKLTEQELIRRQRKVLSEADRRLIEEEQRWIEARKYNRERIRELQEMGEYHAGRKQAAMEAEYWAQQRMRVGKDADYNPIKLFQREIDNEIEKSR
jgi:hypothetical protein